MTPHFQDDAVTLHAGDCLDVLRGMADASMDAVVCDPPYGLEFMGNEWDGADGFRRSLNPADVGRDNAFGRASRTSPEYRAGSVFQQWCLEWAAECLRVLKPGGMMLAFGGTRTWHRLSCAIEDAGFEIRDSIAWVYASGFPKSLNVGIAVMKSQGLDPLTDEWTPEAEAWRGHGTALKPAFEPIVVARKPLAGTVAQTVTTWGTGALNIDGCRVPGAKPDTTRGASVNRSSMAGGALGGQGRVLDDGAGRWPSNLVLSHAATPDGLDLCADGCVDGCPVRELDQQSGVSASPSGPVRQGGTRGYDVASSGRPRVGEGVGYADSGGASRFFPTFRYEPKAPTAERPRVKAEGATGNASFLGGSKRCRVCGCMTLAPPSSSPSCGHDDYERIPSERADAGTIAHPTVKPLDLMRWLVRLVTPPGGRVLDPFAGSGTTGEACIVEGFRCVLVEREPSYLPLIVARLSKPLQPDLFGGVA